MNLLVKKRRMVIPFIVLALSVLSWDTAIRVFQIPAFILPAPIEVYETLALESAKLLKAAGQTLSEILTAAACAITGGFLSALLVFQVPLIRRTIFPYILLTQTMPKVALAPVLIVWFGVGGLSRLVLAFLIAYFPMVINTVTGLSSASGTMITYARSLSATEWQIFFKVRLPNALPSIVGGIKITVAVSVIGIIVGEFVASGGGLGKLIVESAALLETSLTIAAVLLVGVIGLGLLALIEALDRWLIYWNPAE